jgi:general L-amino acid transport system permease protein
VRQPHPNRNGAVVDLGSQILTPTGRKPPPIGLRVTRGAETIAARAYTWARHNLFSSVGNSLLTLLVIAALALVLPGIYDWTVADATISGDRKAACIGDGACWTFIKVRLPSFAGSSWCCC